MMKIFKLVYSFKKKKGWNPYLSHLINEVSDQNQIPDIGQEKLLTPV